MFIDVRIYCSLFLFKCCQLADHFDDVQVIYRS